MKQLLTAILVLLIMPSIAQISYRIQDIYPNLMIIGPDSVGAITLPKIYGGDYKTTTTDGRVILRNETSQIHLFYSLVPDSLQSKPLALQADQLLKESIPSNAQINSSFYKTSSPLTGLPYFRKGIKITNANGQTLEFGVAAYYHPDYRLFAFVMVSVTDSYRYSNTDFLALNSFTWLPKAMLYPENNLKITLPVNLLEKSTFLSEEIDFLNLEALISQASNELNTPSIFISTSSEVCSLDKARDKLSKNKSRIGLDFNRVYQSYETNSFLLRSDEDKYVYRLVVITSSKNGNSPCIKSLFTMKMEFQYEVPKNIDAGAIYIFFNLGGKDTERLYTYYYTWMQYMAATIEM